MEKHTSKLNRAFIYGDLLFETIKVIDGKPLLAQEHFNRLIESATLLKFETTLNTNDFMDSIENAVSKSNLKDARVRFVLHRNASGFYTPKDNQTSYFVDVFPLTMVNKYVHLGIYTDNYKQCSELANVKSGNALLYVMAGIWAKENGFDDALLINEHGSICEATSANVFIIKNKVVYTPLLTEGCVNGVMRNVIIQQLVADKFEVKECILSIEQLMDADSIFLTNAINEVVYVHQVQEKKFAITHIK
jgi:branched-chain amino acid aminotransferase